MSAILAANRARYSVLVAICGCSYCFNGMLCSCSSLMWLRAWTIMHRYSQYKLGNVNKTTEPSITARDANFEALEWRVIWRVMHVIPRIVQVSVTGSRTWNKLNQGLYITHWHWLNYTNLLSTCVKCSIPLQALSTVCAVSQHWAVRGLGHWLQ